MFIQFIIGTILIGLTVLIHALALDFLMRGLERYGPYVRRHFYRYWKVIVITLTVLGVFCANTIQVWLWAVFFYVIDAAPLHSFEEALYFSTSTFTTVGFGDVYLDKDWGLLSSFEAANGMILFGWSTAFIFEVMTKLYKDEKLGR